MSLTPEAFLESEETSSSSCVQILVPPFWSATRLSNTSMEMYRILQARVYLQKRMENRSHRTRVHRAVQPRGSRRSESGSRRASGPFINGILPHVVRQQLGQSAWKDGTSKPGTTRSNPSLSESDPLSHVAGLRIQLGTVQFQV
jgi:hypothetical protein